MNPGISHLGVRCRQKSWAGQATFAMVQTLARNLDLAVADLDLLVIDEAHHCGADLPPVIDTGAARNPEA
jgi:DNA repair protein RadD